jgi:hypothetical protein
VTGKGSLQARRRHKKADKWARQAPGGAEKRRGLVAGYARRHDVFVEIPFQLLMAGGLVLLIS